MEKKEVEELIQIINQKNNDIQSLIQLLERFCQKQLDLKLEYDGGTYCTICGEIYSNLDIQFRLTLQNCSHQAHRQCIYKNIKQQITCCLDHKCLQMNQFWNEEWKYTIICEEENINQFAQFNQQLDQQVIIQKCDECKRELINVDVISLGYCDHLYCKTCVSTLICSYQVRQIYQQNQLICPLCKHPIDNRVIQMIDQNYWQFIVYNRQNPPQQQLYQHKCAVDGHNIDNLESSVTNTICNHVYCQEHFLNITQEYKQFNKFNESEVVCVQCNQPFDLLVIEHNDYKFWLQIMEKKIQQEGQ